MDETGNKEAYLSNPIGLLAIALSITVLIIGYSLLINNNGYAGAASDDSGSCGDDVTYTFDSSTGTLTISGTGDMEDYSWSKSPWYPYRNFIKSIVINDSVTSIGSFAFSGCTSLTSITVSNSITAIGDGAFEHCTSLTSVTIPNSVISIGHYTFLWCISLTSVIIPDSVTSIGNRAFYVCSSLTSVTIPDSIRSIDNGPFASCSSLRSILVDPNNTEFCSVDGVLFNKNKTSLIQYPADKEDSTYTMPSSVIDVKSFAFENCTSLRSVTMSDSVAELGYGAFEGCTSLTSVIIPNSVTTIGMRTFEDCTSLISVTIGDSVVTIEARAFYNCTSITSVTIGSSVKTIGDYAFLNCSSLNSVTIPDSVTSIGDSAFNSCRNLVSINVGLGNLNYCSVSGVLFNKEKTQLIQYPCGKADSFYVLPNSVTTIANGAFNHCTSLSSVTIPDSVTIIGQYAFDYCISLISVTMPSSITAIGSHAFEGCTSLTFVTIPNSVTTIGKYAFYGCTSLTSVTIPDSVTTIGDWAFYYCTSLTSVTIGNSVTTIGDWAFEGITFFDTDGTTELEQNAGNLAGHTFKGTNSKLIKVGSVPIKSSFNITFTYPDGTSSVKSYLEGGTITEPTYSSRTGYTLYWTKDGSEFTFPAIMPSYSFELKAVWKANKYTITFKNWDGTILNSSSYDYGTNVIYNGSTPTRSSDEQWDYTFNGWDRPLSIVTEDTTYTAQYTSKAKQSTSTQYTIVFKNWDESVLSSKEYESGTVASDIAIPTATKDSDSEYTYTFKGWSPQISDVAADAEYTAVFSKTVKVDRKTDGSYSVDISDTSAAFAADTIAEIVEKAKNDGATTMTVSLGDGVISFDNSALQSFGSVDAKLILSRLAKDQMSVDVSKIVGDNVAYDITFGDNRTFGNGKVTVSVAYALDDGRDADRLIVYYIVDGKVAEEISCLYDDGYVTFVTDHLSTYAIMYIEPESDAGFPIMYVAIGIVAVLIVAVYAFFVLKKRV